MANTPTDDVAVATKRLVTLLTWVLKGPPLLGKYSLAAFLNMPQLKIVAGYLNFYKVHVTVLASVMASVKRAEPIAEATEQLEKNIKAYVAEATEVARRLTAEVPSSPIPAQAGLATVIMAPILAKDPRFVEAWNGHLDAYQALAQAGLGACEYLAEQGRTIEMETEKQVDALKHQVDGLKKATNMDLIVGARASERLEFVLLDLTTDVQPARLSAENAAALMRTLVAKAKAVQRIR